MIDEKRASSSANEVSINTLIRSSWARISRVASMPLASGSRTSMTMTSGLVRIASLIASAAVPASATTLRSPACSIIARRPFLMMSWSSTSMTRTGAPLVPGSSAIGPLLDERCCQRRPTLRLARRSIDAGLAKERYARNVRARAEPGLPASVAPAARGLSGGPLAPVRGGDGRASGARHGHDRAGVPRTRLDDVCQHPPHEPDRRRYGGGGGKHCEGDQHSPYLGWMRTGTTARKRHLAP